MIVTLCGSVRFEQEFIIAGRELSRNGILCFTLAVLPAHREPDEGWADGQFDKTIADLLYFKRIVHSNAIVVLGDGYIGLSTSREVLWAYLWNKPIYHHPIGGNWQATCRRLRSRGRGDPDLLKKALEILGSTAAVAHLDTTGMEHPFGFDPSLDVS
jgi:hypothetical protein